MVKTNACDTMLNLKIRCSNDDALYRERVRIYEEMTIGLFGNFRDFPCYL